MLCKCARDAIHATAVRTCEQLSCWKLLFVEIVVLCATSVPLGDVEVIPDDDETPDIGQDAKQDTTVEDIQYADPASKDESIASKRDNILLHPEAKSLEEIIGAKVVTNVLVGDKNPRNFWFQGYPSHVWRVARAYSEDQICPTERSQINGGSNKHVQV